MIGVDLFAGAGGMSRGAKLAGIETMLAIDADPNAAATYAANFPKTNVICSDVRNISDFSHLPIAGDVVLYGGPPCQGFSTSNQRTRNADNVNNWLFTEFVRAVQEIRPGWVVFENVKGIVETESGRFLRYVLEALASLQYKVAYGVLNAVDYGVPQCRSRLFVVGTSTQAKPSLPVGDCKKFVTVGEAIGDLPVLANGDALLCAPYAKDATSSYAQQMRGGETTVANNIVSRNTRKVLDRYKFVPKGGNWEDIPAILMENYSDRSRCHTGVYRRLDDAKPSVVIGNFRKNMLIHPTQDRGLSIREAARLQSFPDCHRFVGSIGFQQQQVGNAVPPLLAQAVFEHIQQLCQQ